MMGCQVWEENWWCVEFDIMPSPVDAVNAAISRSLDSLSICYESFRF